MSAGVVFWDFDGTLASRAGEWTGCTMEVLDETDPGHGIARERVRPGMREGFPWHSPEHAHPELCDSERWWEAVERHIGTVLERAGLPAERCASTARAVRERYLDPAGWRLHEDALLAVGAVAQAGWRCAILSNHVPELPWLVAQLGLSGLVDPVLTSAATGFEKPHPQAFRLALRQCGEPARAWMVGDSLEADVEGARAVGLGAILVGASVPAARSAASLSEAAEIVLGGG